MPVPVRETVAGELAAVLVMVTVPERLVAVAGSNVTVKEVEAPAARASGSVGAAAVNPVPVSEIWEMDTLPLPELVKVTVCVVLVPVATFPKLREAGEAES